MRKNKRKPDQLRDVKIELNVNNYAEGSVIIEMGNTRVLCTASVEESIPPFLRDTGTGWVTAEYSMLPRSTPERNRRDVSKGKLNGRAQEIQRLIGRVLRSVVDFEKLGENSIILDCDVLQADGGTRTASITGAFIALKIAVNKMLKENIINKDPINDYVAAVSVGIVDGELLLDLNYEEDFKADVDMNIAMTGSGDFVEVQGTAEENPFSSKQLQGMLDIAGKGIKELVKMQENCFK